MKKERGPRGTIALIGHPSSYDVLSDIASRAGYTGIPGSLADVQKGQAALLGVNDSISLLLAQILIPKWEDDRELVVAVLDLKYGHALRASDSFIIPSSVRVIAGDPDVDRNELAWMVIPPDERIAA